MFALQARPAAPVVVVGPPSALLTFIAGEFAPRIAGLWPAPHAAFLTASAERRHLICVALAAAPDDWTAARADAVLTQSLKAAVRTALPGAPTGLGRAVGRLGEVAWPARDYLELVRLLTCEVTGKTLRHAAAIDLDLVHALSALPPAFVRARSGGGFALTAAQARLLAEAYAVIRQGQGVDAADQAVRRWAAARSAKALFETVGDSLTPELPASPFPGTERLRPLASKAAMTDAALRYRNCLRTRIPYAVGGDYAYYEWVGPPGVVVEIFRDTVYGWRLDEARIVGNDAVPAATREAINAELRAMGVHVGLTGWQLRNAAERAHHQGFAFSSSSDETVAEFYGD